MKVKVLLFFVFALCFSQLALGQQTAATPEKRGYLVAPGDVITAKVMGEPQFDFVATVDEDGKFQVPFFTQGVMAKCRTEKELRTEVAQLLSKYLKAPEIGLNVQRHSRPPVVVSGEIRKPVDVDLTRRATLLDMITLAGGPTKEAGGLIQVFRPTPPMCNDRDQATIWTAENSSGADVPMRLYTYSNLKSGKEESNPEIFAGDLIIVRKAPPVYVIGEVMRLQQEVLITESGLSLREAIAQVGGVSREAKTKKITIHRLKDNSKERQMIAVNYDLIKTGKQPDIVLQPEDIVEVDKAKKSIAQTILELAMGTAKAATNVIPTRIVY